MSAICILGTQWGDEGKGKVIDMMAKQAKVVVRYAGGNNAGHTVVVGDRKYVLHLLPSGILRPDIVNVLAGGVVVDPWHLAKEIEGLRALGVFVEPGRNLFISRSAHLILPYHRAQDHVMERLRGKGKIGTTGRGIGPAYQDRASRIGLRFGDLEDPDLLRKRLKAVLEFKNPFLLSHGEEPIDGDCLADELLEVGTVLLRGALDTGAYLRTALRENRRILFEGAQGMMLDVDLGTYPYVTSSSVGPGGVASAGVPPRAVQEVLGVAKAYSSRVGEGPFPTEIEGELGERIREQGGEYGSTTGRPRRCGWFDAVAVRYAVDVAGVDRLCLTNLDVLSGLPELRVAVSYLLGGKRYEVYPAGLAGLDEAEVECQDLEPWKENLSGIRDFQDLPRAARDYVFFLERQLGVPIPLISVGPDREQMIHRDTWS